MGQKNSTAISLHFHLQLHNHFVTNDIQFVIYLDTVKASCFNVNSYNVNEK